MTSMKKDTADTAKLSIDEQVFALEDHLPQERFILKILEEAVKVKKTTKQIIRDMEIAICFCYLNSVILILAISAVSSVGISMVFDFEKGQKESLMIWSLLTLSVLIVIFSANYRIFQEKIINIKKLNLYMLLISVVIGLIIAFHLVIVLIYQGLPYNTLHHSHIGFLTFLFIMIMLLIGAFGNRPLYIFILTGIALIPSVFFVVTDFKKVYAEPYFMVYSLIGLVALCIAVVEQYKIRFKSNLQHILYQENLKKSIQDKSLLTEIQDELNNAISNSDDLTSTLEKTVFEKDSVIQQKTQELEENRSSLLNSNNNLNKVQEVAGIASWQWDIAENKVTSSNFDTLLDYSKQEVEVLLNNLKTFIHPEDIKAYKETIKEHLIDGTEKFHIIFRIKNKYNEWIWVESIGLAIEMVPKSNKPKLTVGIIRDITLDKHVNDSLHLSNKVFENSADPIFILDTSFKFISVNPSFERISGYTLEEKENTIFLSDSDGNNNIMQSNVFDSLIERGKFSGIITEFNKKGEKKQLELSINTVADDNDQVTNYVGSFRDITQQNKDKQKMSYLSNYDQLTDLPNRDFFKQQLHSAITDTKEKTSIIRLNVDRFRLVNDTYGSKYADVLLQHISERISKLDYSLWTLARLGSDEFAILYKYKSLYDLKKLLENITNAFQQPFHINKKEVNIRLSIGVSLFPKHGNQVDTLFHKTEQALKVAKNNGGNQYFIYSKNISLNSQDTLIIENELRHAISRGELEVFYQPKVCLKTKSLVGFEGLVRWNHPTKGLLFPDHFLMVATETGLTTDIGNEILSVAFTQIAEWTSNNLIRDKRIALNIEVQQLKHVGFLAHLNQLIANNNINTANLELEITEGSFMDMPEKIIPILEELKKMDITIAMDDFGTGYSSLAYLGQYPIDVIKIDRSFIMHTETDPRSLAIVKAIIAMGKSLGKKIVAEGVETKGHVHLLAAEGCDIAQGYYYGKAVPAEQATKLLEKAKLLNK